MPFIINTYNDEFPHEVSYFCSTVIVIGNLKIKTWLTKRDPYASFRPPLGHRINILIVPFVSSFHDLQNYVSKKVLYLPPTTPVTGKRQGETPNFVKNHLGLIHTTFTCAKVRSTTLYGVIQNV